jgi:hypothetical protein
MLFGKKGEEEVPMGFGTIVAIVVVIILTILVFYAIKKPFSAFAP